MELSKAVFLDRDGTLIVNKGYVHKIEDFQLIKNSTAGLKKFQDAGYKLFIVTNQGGIAKQIYSKEDSEKFNNHLVEELKKQGVFIDGVYYCPHHPEISKCNCRKPEPGLLLKAAQEHSIDLKQSIVVGDKTTDVEAGRRAGAKTVLVKTGDGGKDGRSQAVPDYVADDLLKAAEFIEPQNKFSVNIAEHKKIIEQLSSLSKEINAAANMILEAYKKERKVMIAGNGGSMADSLHFSAELVNSFFNKNRRALSSIALGVNPSIVSAWANDFNHNTQFKREVEAYGQTGDILILISTSGNSKNLIETVQTAKEKGLKLIGLLGRDGGALAKKTDLNIVAPSNSTPRIQEAHQLIYHTICEEVEEKLFKK